MDNFVPENETVIQRIIHMNGALSVLPLQARYIFVSPREAQQFQTDIEQLEKEPIS
jgi:hypothetical protein